MKMTPMELYEKYRRKTEEIDRDTLIDNLFISEYIDCEIYDKDDKMMLLIVEAFEKIYISLRSDMIDIPNRCWLNADGSVYVASGQDDPFLPTLDGDRWYCGDEIYEVGVWTEEDTRESRYMPSLYDWDKKESNRIFDHKHMMCIPKVAYFTTKQETEDMIWERYGDIIKSCE